MSTQRNYHGAEEITTVFCVVLSTVANMGIIKISISRQKTWLVYMMEKSVNLKKATLSSFVQQRWSLKKLCYVKKCQAKKNNYKCWKIPFICELLKKSNSYMKSRTVMVRSWRAEILGRCWSKCIVAILQGEWMLEIERTEPRNSLIILNLILENKWE